jgi:hypothetical protein
MELHAVNLRVVPADALIDFGQEVITRIDQIGSAMQFLSPDYNDFKLWHNRGMGLREILRKSHLTREIERMDKKTQRDYSDIITLAKIAEHDSDAAKVAKAVELLEDMKPFKGISRKDRQTRIGELIVITNIFSVSLISNIEAIGAGTLLNILKGDLANLQALIASRGHEEGVKPDYTFTDVKTGENNAFAGMSTIINGIVGAMIYPDVEVQQKIKDLVIDLNPRIDYYQETYSPKHKAISLNSPQATIEILTPQPVIAAAGAKGQVLIKVRYNTGDPKLGTIELREGFDYIKRYEGNIAPNPSAKVIAHGIGKYKGEKDATFELKISY